MKLEEKNSVIRNSYNKKFKNNIEQKLKSWIQLTNLALTTIQLRLTHPIQD